MNRQTIRTAAAIAALTLGLGMHGIRAEENRDIGDQVLDNWHQWRGPNADGVAPRGDPPLEWDDQKNVRWRVEIPGEGASTPIIWRDSIFVLSAIQTEREAEQPPPPDPRKRTVPPPYYFRFVVLCLDRETGRTVWSRIAREEVPHEGRHPTHTYASSSPTTDGEYLYVSFGSRGTYCYDLGGKLRWERDLGDMRTRFGWGEAISPALHGDRLVVNWDHEDDSFIATLDARTGKTVWKVDRDEPSSWGTPRIVEHKGRTQVIVNGTNRVRSYDLADGRVIWECGGQTEITISSPVILDDLAICMSGYRGSMARAVSLDSTGDLTDTDGIAWSHTRGTPYVPSPILYGERLFFTRTNGDVITVLDARSGKPCGEPRRIPGLSGNLYASPVGAVDRIYFVDRDGTTVVIRNSPDLEVLATNRLGEPVDASPAIVGKQLFLRGKRHLYCFERR